MNGWPVQVRVEVRNFATTVSDEDVGRVLPVLERQANYDFLSIFWKDYPTPADIQGTTVPAGPFLVHLALVPNDQDFGAGVWCAEIYDDGQQAVQNGVANLPPLDIGFHNLDDNGRPFILVLAAQGTSMPWSITFSHELLEAIADPTGKRIYKAGNITYAYEVCDPVAEYAYPLAGVWVSDFVTPHWFEPKAKGTFDFMNMLCASGQVAPGGYLTSKVGDGKWESRTLACGGQVKITEADMDEKGPVDVRLNAAPRAMLRRSFSSRVY